MLRGKFKLPDKNRSLPDRLGTFEARFGDNVENDWGLDLGLELGEELETFRANGLGFEEDEAKECGIDDKRNCRGIKREISASVSSLAMDATWKVRELEFEKVINLETLQSISSSGLPDEGSFRATTWKLLLGYLPSARDSWKGELAESRLKYAALKHDLLLNPSEFTRKDGALVCNDQEKETVVDGLLRRHEVSHGDHPLSLGKASAWNQYFQDAEIADQIDRDLQRTHPGLRFFSGDSSFGLKNREAMRNILLLFAKLNPAIRYVQGMNEVLAPLYYVFSTDPDEENASNAEADSFACFVRLLSDSVDHFCQHLDNSPVGILSTLSRLAELLKANDEALWRHLETTTKVKPQFYAFRWITLLLTQEFNLYAIMRIWDSLLSNPFGLQDMLLRVCCAMLLCVRSELLNGDFTANLKLLQRYPPIDIEYLLHVAQELSPQSCIPLFI
ncbi:uncharacterized protein LOC143846542 isoform X2 [Tasmannia lanceolata]|uniref:uncharacterized protein LOC143846542 isoform X2 n=1 Tax=Tasmannia lanceolata TaxID=3420 RepID=UPI00406331E3